MLAAPTSVDDSYVTEQDTPLDVSAPGVLGNDSDADSDPLSAVLDWPTMSGDLTLFADGSFTYTPYPGFVGTDSFTYYATDGVENGNIATVTIDVAAGGAGGGGSGNTPPDAMADQYTVELDTIAVAVPGVLGNDSDLDGDPLSALLTSDVSHGVLVFNADGSFTYTPNAGFVGTDSFSYQASDGTDLSTAVTVTLDVVKPFGSQLNLPDRPFAGPDWYGLYGTDRLTGDAVVTTPVAPGQVLIYRAATDASPILAVETRFTDSLFAPIPDQVEVRLDFGGVDSGPIYYDSSSLMPGDMVRFAVQTQADTLSTGRYAWTLDVISYYGGDTSTQFFTGFEPVVNRTESVFGSGWTLAGLDQLVPQTGGVLWVSGRGPTAWFTDNGDGSFTSPVGPMATFTLTQNADGSYTLRNKYGDRSEFDSSGLLTARVDRNGNTTQYAYTDANADGLAEELSQITDPFGRAITFAYAGGLVTTITDFAGRTTTLTHDASGRLTAVTRPDPDDSGPLSAPVTSYGYSSDGRLTQITGSLGAATSLQYNFAGRLVQATDALGNTRYFDPIQTQALVDTASGLGSSTNPAPIFIVDSPLSAGADDPLGNQVAYQVDRFGFVTEFTDALGNVTTYQRDADGRVTQRTQPDPDGAGPLDAPVTSYSYDSSGNLTQVTLPDGTTQSWVYDPNLNQPTQFTDALGRVTTWTYDANGNMLTATDPLGNVTGYSYDSRGLVTSITQPDPDGTGPLAAPVTSFAYDSSGRLVTITLPDASTQQFAYDSADNVVSVTDELGRVTTLAYDSLDRLTSRTLPDPDGEGPLAAPVITFQYDAASRLIRQTDPAGGVTGYSYNALGQLLSVTQPDPDGAGPLAAPVTRFAYDAAGRRTAVTDPLGSTTTFDYDGRGLLTTVTRPDPDGGSPLAPPTVSYAYDNLGRRTRVTDPLGNQTTFAYDIMSRLTSVTDALGGVTSYGYDAVGNRTSITDPLGNTTTFAFDELDRLVSTTQPDPDGSGPLSSPVTTYAYDNLGRLTSVTDPSGGTTSYEYDVRSRRTSLTDAMGNTTSFSFDAVGNLTSVTDPLGNVTTYAYDNLNRRTSTTDANGGVTSFSYDILGNLTGLTDPVGNTTTFAFDGLSRLTGETNALGDSRSYSYDAAGNVTARTDRLGRTIELTYDNLSRRIEERWIDSDGTTVVNTIDLGHDAADRLTTVSDGVSAYSLSYDALGRLTGVDNAGTPGAPNVVLSAAYDAAGRRTQLSATIDGTADFLNTYQFDNLGRVTRVEQTGQGGNAVAEKRVDISYTDRGQFASITRYEDLAATLSVAETTYTYDSAGRLTNLDHSTLNSQPSTLAAYSWTYDAAGRITSATTPDGTTTYSYDSTGQLVGADHSYQADESYSYDANGNRTMAGYQTGTNNQLLSDGTYNYQYDAEGNRTKKTNIATGETVQYNWDHRNRLTKVTFKDGAGTVTKVVEYDYDVFNRRIAKRVDDDGDGTVDRSYRFVYDSSGKLDPGTGVPLDDVVLVFEDPDGSGSQPFALSSRLLHGPAIDQIFASESATGEILWALADHQGTVRDWVTYDAASDTTGVVHHLKYDSFGRITAIEDGSGNPAALRSPLSALSYSYTGRVWDADAELYFYRARWYDPTTGRFISEDPIGFAAGDANVSRYVGNGVTTRVDPSGLFLETIWDVINVVMDVVSLVENVAHGNWGGAAIDAGSLGVDVAATFIPFVPGGAGAVCRAGRLGADAADGAALSPPDRRYRALRRCGNSCGGGAAVPSRDRRGRRG